MELKPPDNLDDNLKSFNEEINKAESVHKSLSNPRKDFKNPDMQKRVNQIDNTASKRSTLEKLSWIIGIIGGLIAIYEFIIKGFLNN